MREQLTQRLLQSCNISGLGSNIEAYTEQILSQTCSDEDFIFKVIVVIFIVEVWLVGS